jgi:hypothetical protein
VRNARAFCVCRVARNIDVIIECAFFRVLPPPWRRTCFNEVVETINDPGSAAGRIEEADLVILVRARKSALSINRRHLHMRNAAIFFVVEIRREKIHVERLNVVASSSGQHSL